MTSQRTREGRDELIAELVRAEGPGARSRVLLDGASRWAGLAACALWRRGELPGNWMRVLARGPEARLPDADFLEAVASGRTSPDLLPGVHALFATGEASGLALTYVGESEDEEGADLLEGLLQLVQVLDGDQPTPLEQLVPVLPGPAEVACSAALLLRGTRQVLEGSTAAFDPRERAHFEALLELEPQQEGGPSAKAVLLDPPASSSSQCDATALLRELARAETSLCSGSGIELRLAIAPQIESRCIEMPASEFICAVQNLLLNAREAQELSRHSGWIVIELSQAADPRNLLLRISDGGPGLPSEVHAALAAGQPDQLPGPGLGLAIALGIVTERGGSIAVASSAEVGTRLEITLALASSQ